jgi:hypothetical protein
MMNTAQFAERFGEPSSYVFNGTYYDTGVDAKQACSGCSRIIRYCYIVKRNPASTLPANKLTIGSCCFSFFDEKTQQALAAARDVIQHRAEAIEIETALYTRRADVKSRLRQWQQIKRQALSQVRQYRKASGKEWLPESLFDLSVTASQEPPTYKHSGNTIRWYADQTRKLEEQINKISI